MNANITNISNVLPGHLVKSNGFVWRVVEAEATDDNMRLVMTQHLYAQPTADVCKVVNVPMSIQVELIEN